MIVRRLNPEDVEDYRELRLEALRDPTAYVTDVVEEEAVPLAEMRERLADESPARTFGAFLQVDAEQRLVGIGTLARNTRIRTKFLATIVGMYVSAECRRQGVARKLLAACIEHARAFPEIEEVCLAVTVGNDAARRVYLAYGFKSEYVEPRYFKYDGRYYDEEWMRLAPAVGACGYRLNKNAGLLISAQPRS